MITNVILSTLFNNNLCWRENLLFFTLFCCISLVLWPWWWKEVFSFPIVDKLFTSNIKKNCTKTHYTIFVHKCVCQNWEENPFSSVQRSQCFLSKKHIIQVWNIKVYFLFKTVQEMVFFRLGWNRTRICESELYGNPEVCSLFICFHIPL